MNEVLRGLPGIRDLGDGLYMLLGAVAIILLAWIVDLLTRRILLVILRRIIRHTKTRWDDALLDRKFLHRVAHLAPALVVSLTAPLVFGGMDTAMLVINKAVSLYIALLGLLAFFSFLDGLLDIYRSYAVSKNRPIKGYLQVVKIIVGIAVSIYIISALMGRSPVVLLGGLGAMTAVLLLIFKDTILGFVASIQLTGNDMIRMGDWISMPQYGADGDVIDLTLTTVKVQNWDKTITTIPTYALVASSFQNWRGMDESGGRRIKRAVNIDMTSIEFCTDEMIDRFRRFRILGDYITGKEKEIAEWNNAQAVSEEALVNGRRMTNVGTFRAYVTEYLRQHPMLKQDMTCMVRQLKPGEDGLPIEIYTFSSDQRWVEYEGIQADIFDHILAVLPQFGLRIFQNPTGADFRKL
ncbi:mechanosensitive ion channel family protein [bacterium]|nr:mechanosensitive ion channel family protein [bacterium]